MRQNHCRGGQRDARYLGRPQGPIQTDVSASIALRFTITLAGRDRYG